MVCLTNHALDSFLSGLQDAGVENLLRIGAGSKEPWTDPINLTHKRRKARFSPNEMSQLKDFNTQASGILDDIDSWCRGQSSQELTGEVKWFAVQSILFNYHRNAYDQFKTPTASSAVVALLFEYWAKGGDIQNLTHLRAALVKRLSKKQSKDDSNDMLNVEKIMDEMTSTAFEQDALLGNDSIWNVPANEREALIQAWASTVDTSTLAEDLAKWYLDHQYTRDKAQNIRNARDVRIMQQANVIGMTTTACAGKWDLLNALDLDILVCEEAGEVLEPHVVCSLLPTLQHAIFIGDPQQLRPEVSNYGLSLECSPDYRLDESLFEKMIFPRDPALTALPMAQLNIQRRMHPAISDISRITYPYLQDHPSTIEHEPTIGLSQRVFWWDHRVPELDDIGVTKSHVNQHEVDMVGGVVQYLLKGSAYSQGDIAVLTPYSGQLARLHDCLKSTCNIWLNERDREILLSQELLEAEEGPRSKDDVSVSDMLRISTVDNFQGEEAKVVILTTVRSGGRPGFLAIPNRINVACSRARNGFYIIGNSETLGQVDMWKDIITLFGTRRGFELTTHCPNHPEHCYDVFKPQDFDSIPECSVACDAVLPCGHRCPEKCHPLKLHENNIIPCALPCEKHLPCGHRCTKKCGEICGPCQIATAEVELPKCGHQGVMFCSGQISKCKVDLGKVELECGHKISIMCGEAYEDLSCKQPCHGFLNCGHTCPNVCGSCRKQGVHAKCGRVCGKPLKCDHSCDDECGHEGVCAPCEKTFRIACEHGVRTKLCSQPVELCMKPQSVGLGLPDTQTPCCLPTLNLPSSGICKRQLACGHECLSLESETCIPALRCLRCHHEETSKTQIFIAECGHLVDMESLDALNLQGVYATGSVGNLIGTASVNLATLETPKCTCGTAIRSIRRYRQISKFFELPTTVDTFVARLFAQLEAFSFQVESMEQQTLNSFVLFKNELRPGPLAANANRRALMMRKDLSKDVIEQIATYRGKLYFFLPAIYVY